MFLMLPALCKGGQQKTLWTKDGILMSTKLLLWWHFVHKKKKGKDEATAQFRIKVSF